MAQEGWTQAELAQALKTSPTQVSRWLAQTETGSLTVFCNHLRDFANGSPDKWLNLVGSPEFLEALPQLQNLTYFDYTFGYPNGPMWVISNSPLEFDIEEMRIATAARIKADVTDGQPNLVYWVPGSTEARVRQLFLRLHNKDKISKEDLRRKVKVIFCPQHLFLFNIGILNPISDNRVGFISTYRDSGLNLRMQILPSNALLRICNLLSPVIEEFLFNPGTYDTKIDGFKWESYDPLGATK